MKCPACGTRNNYYHRYCYFCGEKLGAMVDPPDRATRSPGYGTAQGGDGPSSSSSSYPYGMKQDSYGTKQDTDYSEQPYFTQENQSIDDLEEDYFGYPADDPPMSPPKTDIPTYKIEAADDLSSAEIVTPEDEFIGEIRDETVADIEPSGDDFRPFEPPRYTRQEPAAAAPPESPTAAPHKTVQEEIASLEEDIAAKISSMEKYMDDYLAGRIGARQEPAPPTPSDESPPVYNDSLDFIRIEGEEPSQPEPIPEPTHRPDIRAARDFRHEYQPEYRPRQAASAPPPAPPVPPAVVGTDMAEEEYDPFEDEETSRMIDMLYDGESAESSYPRRSRRHASAKEEPEAEEDLDIPDGNTIVKVLISVVIIALMAFAGYVLYKEVLSPHDILPSSTTDLLVTHTLERETLDDGTTGQRLTLYAPGAATAAIFGETYPVENDKVQKFYSDDFLLSQYQAAEAPEGGTLTTVVTVYDSEGKTIEHEVIFPLSSPSVPLSVLSPEGDTVDVQGSACTLEISVQPGAQLFINGIDYTGQVGPDGLAVVVIDVNGTEPVPVTIRASLEGYADAEKTITLVPSKAAAEESLLSVNESIPLSTTAGEVTLTGHVPSGATIQASLPLVGTPSVAEDGTFSLKVQIPSRPGYSVCVLTAMLDGTQVEQKEVIIEKSSTFNEYTTGPWEFTPYADYKANPDLHAGYRFKIPGKVKEVLSQSDGLTVCTVNVNPSGEEQLIRVWFWGDFSHTAGSSVIVYGNRWGNEEGIPRILARYIVSN